MKRDPALADILNRRGMTKRIAEACGVTHSAVSQWRHVPTRHIRVVADLAGVPVERLVPSAAERPAA